MVEFLNLDLIDRAIWQDYLKLDITGDYIEGLKIYRRKDTIYMSYNDKIIVSGKGVYNLEYIDRLYQKLSGKRITYGRGASLMKNIDVRKYALKWHIENPQETKRTINVMRILRNKGIDYII